MRIGIDLSAAVTQGGGIGRYTRELVQALVQIDTVNQYRFFSSKQPQPLLVPGAIPKGENIQYRQSPLTDHWHYRLWYRLRLPLPVQLLTGKIDLFHSPDFVLPPLLPKVPSLLTVHDLSFLHFPETFPPTLVAYLQRVVPWSIKRADHIVADSEATKRDLTHLWQVPVEKITVLLSGVNPKFQPVSHTAVLKTMRQKYDIGDTPYLLSVGTIQPRKNYKFLIQAFKPVAEKFPHNLIISGGKGWLYDEMIAEIEAQQLQGRVKFIGFVEDSDLPALYSDADLFLFPSLYEGFGLPLLEAMGCGTPVLSSNASSLPEVGQNTAVYLPPTDRQLWCETIIDLLENEAKRLTLSRQGISHVTDWTWQKTAVQLLKIYQNVSQS